MLLLAAVFRDLTTVPGILVCATCVQVATSVPSGIASLLQMLQKHGRLQPACMTMQLLHVDDEEASRRQLQDEGFADKTPVLQVCGMAVYLVAM